MIIDIDIYLSDNCFFNRFTLAYVYIDQMKILEKSSMFSITHEDHVDSQVIIEFYNRTLCLT